jgi:hypothetical protein
MKREIKSNTILFLDKNNFPIEVIIGRPFLTFFRRLFLTRRIMKYKTWKEKGGCKIVN